MNIFYTTVCDCAWRPGKVSDEWMKAIIMFLHSGKGGKSECNNCSRISLFSVPVKAYGSLDCEINGDN